MRLARICRDPGAPNHLDKSFKESDHFLAAPRRAIASLVKRIFFSSTGPNSSIAFLIKPRLTA